MKLTKFNKEYGVVLIPDFEEFNYSYRIAYMACFLYDYLKAMTFPSIGDFHKYSESRAETTARDIRGLLEFRKLGVFLRDPYKKFNLKGKFNEGEKIFTLDIEMNSHLGFIFDREQACRFPRWNHLTSSNSLGICFMELTRDINIFGRKEINFSVRIKTTDPATGIDLLPEEILDSIIHEFVHCMDYMEIYFGFETKKYDSYKPLIRSWLARILEHFFVFK